MIAIRGNMERAECHDFAALGKVVVRAGKGGTPSRFRACLTDHLFGACTARYLRSWTRNALDPTLPPAERFGALVVSAKEGFDGLT